MGTDSTMSELEMARGFFLSCCKDSKKVHRCTKTLVHIVERSDCTQIAGPQALRFY